jgi:hypothetical protein
MNATLQSIIALAAVGLALGWLGWRAFAHRGQPGCGSSGCACAADGIKVGLRRLPPAGAPPPAKSTNG